MRATCFWLFTPLGELRQYKADDHTDEWQVVEVNGDVEDAQYFVALVHLLVFAVSICVRHSKRSHVAPLVVAYFCQLIFVAFLARGMFNYENFGNEFFCYQNSERFILHGIKDHFVELSDDNERNEITNYR